MALLDTCANIARLVNDYLLVLEPILSIPHIRKFGITRAYSSPSLKGNAKSAVGLLRLMNLEAKNALLRIAIRSTQDQDTWILEGRLAGQVVDELTTSWRQSLSEDPRRKRVVDLVGVSFVDERGERALLEMMIEGAQFFARGVYMKSLLQSLNQRYTREA